MVGLGSKLLILYVLQPKYQESSQQVGETLLLKSRPSVAKVKNNRKAVGVYRQLRYTCSVKHINILK